MRTLQKSCTLPLLLLMLLSFCLTLTACESVSTYEKSYKVLSGTKVTMETLGSAAKDLHRQGRLTDEQIAQAEKAYVLAQGIQLQFIKAQQAAILSDEEQPKEQAALLGVAYLKAATEFINLAISFGLIKPDDPSITVITSSGG